MNIKFVGEPLYDGSTNTLQVVASVEGQPIRCVVSAESLQALSNEQTTSVNVAQTSDSGKTSSGRLLSRGSSVLATKDPTASSSKPRTFPVVGCE